MRPQLLLALATFVYGVVASEYGCGAPPAHADAWTDQEVALGKLCWNEASTNRNDCIAIVEARGHLTLPELQAMHRRALAPVRTDGRRWIASLSGTMAPPQHWPEDRVPWNPRGLAMWSTVLETVRATLRGELSVCDVRAQVWGSRTLDAARLARIFARGGREVCHGTANQFVVFGGRRE